MSNYPNTKFQRMLDRMAACEDARIWVGRRGVRWSWHNCHVPSWMQFLLEEWVAAHPDYEWAQARADEVHQAVRLAALTVELMEQRFDLPWDSPFEYQEMVCDVIRRTATMFISHVYGWIDREGAPK